MSPLGFLFYVSSSAFCSCAHGCSASGLLPRCFLQDSLHVSSSMSSVHDFASSIPPPHFLIHDFFLCPASFLQFSSMTFHDCMLLLREFTVHDSASSIHTWQCDPESHLYYQLVFLAALKIHSMPITSAHDLKTHVHMGAHIHSDGWPWNWLRQVYRKHSKHAWNSCSLCRYRLRLLAGSGIGLASLCYRLLQKFSWCGSLGAYLSKNHVCVCTQSQ